MGSGDLHAIRIGGHAHRYLAVRSRTGRAVSLFRCGFNVLFDERTEPAIVSIQLPAVPLHPWGLQIDELPNNPRTGCRARVDAGVLHVDGLRIALGDADLFERKVKPYSFEESVRARVRAPLLQVWPTAAGPCDEPVAAAVERWRATGEDGILLELIGLGSGSTPAGDDVLVGLIFGFTVLRWGPRLEAVRRADTESKTHLRSAQMITAALDGAFPEPLYNLLRVLGEENAEESSIGELAQQVGRLGSSSGKMMLRGLVAALESGS